MLFKLRDAIAHLKPYRLTYTRSGTIEMEPAKLLSELHRRKLIADPTQRPAQSFLTLIASAALCAWAVKTARWVVSYIVDLIPKGGFKDKLVSLAPDILSE